MKLEEGTEVAHETQAGQSPNFSSRPFTLWIYGGLDVLGGEEGGVEFVEGLL